MICISLITLQKDCNGGPKMTRGCDDECFLTDHEAS